MTIAAIALSYLIGCTPTGLWLGLRLRGIDLRRHGSLNIGATNTMRVLGKRLGAVALAGDMAKGAIAVLVFGRMGAWEHLPVVCGLAAILGHTAPIYLRFHGGKGVATGAGTFLALCPIPTLIAGAVFALTAATTRMVSAGSMSAAVTLCAVLYVTDASWVIRLIATFVTLLILWRHRTNIRRILRREENRI